MRTYGLKTKLYAITLTLLLGAAITFNYQRNHVAKTTTLPVAKGNNYEAVFSEIYDQSHWGKGSGLGSDPQYAAQYIGLLQLYFNDPRFYKIVDLGCGDWQIMRNIMVPANKSYTGFDVVPSVIDINKAEFSRENVQFYHVKSLQDFAAQKVSGDLLIIKDVLQHWPIAEIKYFLANVLPNFKYALITNRYTFESRHNKDVILGPVRSVGLLDEPFNLQHAIDILEYYGPEHKQVIFYKNPNFH